VDASNQMPIVQFCQEALANPNFFKLGNKQREGLKDYLQIIHSLRAKRQELPLHELIAETIRSFRYHQYLEEDQETVQDRKENIDELISKAAEWQQEHPEANLNQFLEELALRTN